MTIERGLVKGRMEVHILGSFAGIKNMRQPSVCTVMENNLQILLSRKKISVSQNIYLYIKAGYV
jgi:hypothetical protein